MRLPENHIPDCAGALCGESVPTRGKRSTRTGPTTPKAGLRAVAGAGDELARPERLELPTNWFEASYSIQLSYGRNTWITLSQYIPVAGFQLGLPRPRVRD